MSKRGESKTVTKDMRSLLTLDGKGLNSIYVNIMGVVEGIFMRIMVVVKTMRVMGNDS